MSSGTALHNIEDADTARQLVELVQLSRQRQFTVFHLAAENGRTDVVEYLCSFSLADELILKKDDNGRTALHYAKNREIAKLLVESILPENQKAFILCVDEKQYTALHAAADSGRTDVVDYLCSLSLADDELILKKDTDGQTALHYTKSREIAGLLVESVLQEHHQPFILSVNKNQHTALHLAVLFEKIPVVEYLCSFSKLSVSLIFEQDLFNNTAMHYTTNREIVSCMLSSLQDAQIDKLLSLTNDAGYTPILSLVEFGQHESLAELLRHIENETDLDIATYLEQHNYEGQSILHLAALSLFLDSIYDVLQDYVGGLNFEKMMYADKLENTPIHYVVAKYDTRIFADFMLHLPSPMRQEVANLSNSKLVDYRVIIQQKKFSELFYIKRILADDEHSTLAEKFQVYEFFRKDCKLQLTQPENFYKYDETILKVLKYCLNEYSLLDCAYTVAHSLFLAAVQQDMEPENRVSKYV